jgi:chaperonin GroEL
LEEKYDRAEDALLAARAAIADGIVPGGSYSYIKALKCKEFIKLCRSNNLGDNIGANIIKIALMAPFKKLFFNMGNIDNAANAINKIKNAPLDNVGFNIKSGKFENLLETGVVDPFKVTYSALQNASSVAGLMLTSNVVIGNLRNNSKDTEKTSSPPPLF